MKQVLFVLLTVIMCSCESQSGHMIEQQKLIRVASQDSTKRDSLIEATIHRLAELYPESYRIEDSTEEDESYHSVVVHNNIIYAIGDQTGIQTVTVISDDQTAVRIMRQLDYNHVSYSAEKSGTDVWDITYRDIIYVPNL